MGEMRLGPVARGLLSYFPALDRLLPSKTVGHTGFRQVLLRRLDETPDVIECQRHFRAFPTPSPNSVRANPWASACCALLSGADHYVGLDVIAHSNPESNRLVLRDLVSLFQERAPNPDKGWPEFTSFLDERSFPSHVLTEDRLPDRR